MCVSEFLFFFPDHEPGCRWGLSWSLSFMVPCVAVGPPTFSRLCVTLNSFPSFLITSPDSSCSSLLLSSLELSDTQVYEPEIRGWVQVGSVLVDGQHRLGAYIYESALAWPIPPYSNCPQFGEEGVNSAFSQTGVARRIFVYCCVWLWFFVLPWLALDSSSSPLTTRLGAGGVCPGRRTAPPRRIHAPGQEGPT